MSAAQLTNLADNPELVPLLAEWQHHQFSYLARALRAISVRSASKVISSTGQYRQPLWPGSMARPLDAPVSSPTT